MRISSLFMLAAAVALPAFAQQEMKVDGLVIELGVMPAEKAVHAAGHATAHPQKFPSGSQHLLITVAEQKPGRRVPDGDVVFEVVAPRGRATTKTLIHTTAGRIGKAPPGLLHGD